MRRFVGGYQGAGTRAVQFLMEEADVFIGDLVDKARDYIPLSGYKQQLLQDNPTPGFTHREALEILFGSWWPKDDFSIKLGATALAIPQLKEAFPEAKFIVVVRHGVDNIIKRNMEEREGAMVAPSIFEIDDLFERRMAFWTAFHLKALEAADESVYFIKLEDLCAKPEEETKKLFEWANIDADAAECSKVIKTPDSIGRRKENHFVYNPLGEDLSYFPHYYRERLYKIGEEVLEHFDYEV